MKHSRLFLSSLVVLPLLLSGCEKKTTAAPDAAKAGSPAAATAAAPTGPLMTVGFELQAPATVGALQFDVQYAGEGRFVGDNDAVACETKIEGALSSYNHIVTDKNLRAAFIAVKGFSGPIVVSECKFEGTAKAEDFTVVVKDASTPDLAEITPTPAVKVLLN